MRFALAEKGEGGERKERRARERERKGRGWIIGRGKTRSSIASVIGNGLCVLVSRVLMMESRVGCGGEVVDG